MEQELFKVMVSVMGLPLVFQENVEEAELETVVIEAETKHPLDRVYVEEQ